MTDLTIKLLKEMWGSAASFSCFIIVKWPSHRLFKYSYLKMFNGRLTFFNYFSYILYPQKVDRVCLQTSDAASSKATKK